MLQRYWGRHVQPESTGEPGPARRRSGFLKLCLVGGKRSCNVSSDYFQGSRRTAGGLAITAKELLNFAEHPQSKKNCKSGRRAKLRRS
jgi:hypothetical protein